MRQQIATTYAIKIEDGAYLMNRVEMEHRVQDFYISLFATKTTVPLDENHCEEEHVLPVSVSEVWAAVWTFNADKAPDLDSITNETLNTGRSEVWKVPAKLFNECLESADILADWKISFAIIIPTKDERAYLKHY
jgi:hypothetical protein